MNIKGYMKTLAEACKKDGCMNVLRNTVCMIIYAKRIGCKVYRNGACYLWNDPKRLQMLSEKDSRDYWAGKSDWSYQKVFPKRYKAMYHFLKNNFWNRLDSSSMVADLPCAEGEWTFKTAKYAGFVDGYEYSEKMVKAAKRNAKRLGVCNVAFAQLDATKERIKKKYDFFMLLGLLTCIYDETAAEKIISNVAASLQGGGYLVSKDSLHEEDRQEPIYTYSALNGYTAIYRSKCAYNNLFNKYGFELVAVRYLAAEKMPAFHYCSGIFLWKKRPDLEMADRMPERSMYGYKKDTGNEPCDIE